MNGQRRLSMKIIGLGKIDIVDSDGDGWDEGGGVWQCGGGSTHGDDGVGFGADLPEGRGRASPRLRREASEARKGERKGWGGDGKSSICRLPIKRRLELARPSPCEAEASTDWRPLGEGVAMEPPRSGMKGTEDDEVKSILLWKDNELINPVYIS